jgi:transketolase
MDVERLKRLSKEVRKRSITYIKNSTGGHPGGALSCADILTALYFEILRPSPYQPDHPNRDIIILSKGHSDPALYACWDLLIEESHNYLDPDFISLPPWWDGGPMTLRQINSPFQGHPSLTHTPWCETSTGSLGQGFAVAVGMAYGFKQTGQDRRVYVVLGDGEMQEGIVAEGARVAAWLQLNNLTAIVDFNGLASDRYSRTIDDPEGEFVAWGWAVNSCDGHDFEELKYFFDYKAGPSCIVAYTVKGKGVPDWESDEDGFHGSCVLSQDDVKMAMEALGNKDDS